MASPIESIGFMHGLHNYPKLPKPSGGSDRQACWEDGSEINDGCGKIGIISRDQKKVF
jgi:hypothetical protein